MQPISFELLWRRAEDLMTLELLACALEEAGESVRLSPAPGVRDEDGEDAPVACWVRVALVGAGPIPEGDTLLRVAIEDRIESGAAGELPEELRACDLALVAGPARACAIAEGGGGEAHACGLVRLDLLLDQERFASLASEDLLCPGPALPRIVETLLEALGRLREEHASAPGDPEVFDAMRARVAFGDAEGAVAQLGRHLLARPSAEGYRLLASVERTRGAPDAAGRALDRAERLAGEELARVLCERGRLEVGGGSPAAARDAFERALGLDEGCADAHCGLGAIDLAGGDAAAGEASFRRALQLEKSPRAWCGLGLALLAGQQAREALPAFERALELDGELLQALYGLVRAGFASGDPTCAERWVRSFVELHPGNLDMAFTLAGLRTELGDVEGAREVVARIELFDPEYPGLADLRTKLDSGA